MLRCSSNTILKPIAIILVATSGRQTRLTRIPVAAAFGLCRQYTGVLYRVRRKSTPVAPPPPPAAYFPKICDIAPAFAPSCILLLLSKRHARGRCLRPRQLVFPAGFSPDTLCPHHMFFTGEGRLPGDIRLPKNPFPSN